MAGATTAGTGLTIHIEPGNIIAGQGVLVYGHLGGPDDADRKIVLHVRIAPASTFSTAPATTTNTTGQYEFEQGVGSVTTNRSWYVTAGDLQSATRTERVAALLSLAVSTIATVTNHPLTLSGTIFPSRAGEQVSLQVQHEGAGAAWRTVTQALTGPHGGYSIPYRFRVPGGYSLRVRFAGDTTNTTAESDPVTVVVQQTENPSFTIQTSAPVIDAGQSVTISGVVFQPHTTTPVAGARVVLWGHQHGAPYAPLGSTVTAADGGYSITQTPVSNEVYEARASGPGLVHSEQRFVRTMQLFMIVRPVVTLSAAATNAALGGTDVFSGSVTPNRAGGVVELEQNGSDAVYHLIGRGRLSSNSTYSISWTFASSGSQKFRVAVPGRATYATGFSPPVTVTITP